jgi:peptide/nickel transport system permease protein
MKKLIRFLKRWQNLLAVFIISLFVITALIAPLIAPANPKSLMPGFQIAGDVHTRIPQAPRPGVPLGSLPFASSQQQLDIFYTIVWGTRSALHFGFTVALFTALFGITVGAISGYLGGAPNDIIMRITDAFLAFPIIVGVVFIQQLYLLMVEASGGTVILGFIDPGPAGSNTLVQFFERIDPVMLAIILFSWMIYARITNALVLRIKDLEYVQAARALGAGHSRIIFRHLIPNAISPAIILFTRDIGAIVLLQAALTFIGLGGGSLWGELLVISRRWIIGPGGNLFAYWWTYIPVTLAIIFFGMGWNLLGDGLNDWLNPRSAQHFEL